MWAVLDTKLFDSSQISSLNHLDKAEPFTMSTLKGFIKAVRSAKTAADERMPYLL